MSHNIGNPTNRELADAQRDRTVALLDEGNTDTDSTDAIAHAVLATTYMLAEICDVLVTIRFAITEYV